MRWRRNPQRVAWLILSVSLFACCVLAVMVPLGMRSYLLHATQSRPVYVTALSGTAQVYPPGPGVDDPMAVRESRGISEGSRVATDDTTRALMTVFADEQSTQVLVTVQLSENTAVTLRRIRVPRFSLSRDPFQIDLELERGRVYVTTQAAEDRSVTTRLVTEQASTVFGTGTFDLITEGEETQVRVRSGEADVMAAGRVVVANTGERVSVITGHAPELPVPAALNLVLNGTFEDRITPPWQKIQEVPSGLPPGEITVEDIGERRAVRFTRRAEDGAPNRVGLQQSLDRDVQGYDSLVLSFDLQLLYQSVPGGGYLATEYPVMVDLLYTDVYGKDLHLYLGFYYLDLPPGSTYLPPTGEKVPMGIWYNYESPNLYELLRDTRPARVNSITIYASGHDYDSLVSDVALIVR
jgi:hypothetical protein